MAARLNLLSVLLALLTAAMPAKCMTFEVMHQGDVKGISGAGEIEDGDSIELANMIAKRGPLAFIELRSPGGLLLEGLRLGEVIRANKLATRIPRNQECTSACVYAFVGGIIREVEPGAKIGVHMASMMMSDAYISEMYELLTDQSIPVDVRIRLMVALNERESAQAALVQTQHLLKMGISTRLLYLSFEKLQIDVHYLTSSEMRDLNLLN